MMAGASQAGFEAQAPGLLVAKESKSSQSPSQQREAEEARRSQNTPSHSQFGGAPKDQGTRERQHPQYPETAQHLGPRDAESNTGGNQASPSGKPQKRNDAISGVGQ